jgi:chromosome segregation ATPase
VTQPENPSSESSPLDAVSQAADPIDHSHVESPSLAIALSLAPPEPSSQPSIPFQQNDTLISELDSLRSLVETLQLEKSDILSRNEDLEEQLSSVPLSSEHDKFIDLVHQLEAENAKIKSEYESLLSQYTDSQEKIAAQGSVISQLEHDLHYRGTENIPSTEDYSKRILDLESLLEEKSAKIDSFFTMAKEADDRADLAELNFSRASEAFETEKAELLDKLKRQSDVDASKDSKIKELEASLNDFKLTWLQEKEALNLTWSSRLEKIQSEHTASSETRGDTIFTLQESLRELQSEKSHMSDLVAGTTGRLSSLQNENKSLLDQLEELRNAYVKSQNDYGQVVNTLHSESTKVKT